MNQPIRTISKKTSNKLLTPTSARAISSRDESASSALTRLLAILDLFTLQHPVVRVEEVVAKFGIVQSTAYRYLKELCDAGLLAQQGKGVYSLGRRIVELERLLQLSDPLLLAGRPVMDALHESCDNRAFLLCAYHRDAALCVYKVGPDEITFKGSNMKIMRGRGTVLPLFSGAGSQALLANLPPHQVKSLYLSNSPQIAEAGLGNTWKDFRGVLAEIRRLGFAQTIGKMNPGMHSVAVPIVRVDGKVAGSLLMLGSASATSMKRAVEFVPFLQRNAAAIASEMNMAQSD
ncbi:MAG: IclR family transcriptional regulator C-terminal domain-containing protein [Casimicrobium sp.]